MGRDTHGGREPAELLGREALYRSELGDEVGEKSNVCSRARNDAHVQHTRTCNALQYAQTLDTHAHTWYAHARAP